MGGTGAEAAIWGRSIEGSLFSTRVFKVCHFSLVGVVVFLGRSFTLKPSSANGNSESAFFGTPCIV